MWKKIKMYFLFAFVLICFSCAKDSTSPSSEINETNTSYSNPGRPSSYTFGTTNTTTITTTTNTATYTTTYTQSGSKVYKMDTYTSNDWDYWQIKFGDTTGFFRTYTSNDWDYWEFKFNNAKGKIKTYTSNDWDYWEFFGTNKNMTIRTFTSEDWDYWEIQDKSANQKITVKTNFSNDFDSWTALKNGKEIMRFSTNFSNDYDNWRFYPKDSTIDEEQLAAIHFIAVFASSIHMQNINK